MASITDLLSPIALLMCAACAGTGPNKSFKWWASHPPIPQVETSSAPDGIVPLPYGTHPALRRIFSKYTKLTAPNGRPIHFLAQSGVADEHLKRARELMRFFLTDAPGTLFGGDKSEVANSMADHWATLMVFETQQNSFRAQTGELQTIPLLHQELLATESVVEGTKAYLNNTFRDGTIEAVFRLVHRAGIRWALPAFHQAIEDGAHAAVREGRWQTTLDRVLEGSTGIQYMTDVMEVSYGIWAHDPDESGRSFDGEYGVIDRTDQEAGDQSGLELLGMFLPETLDFECRVDSKFEGVFALAETPQSPYTLKSQYLVSVRLSGAHDSGLIGNQFDNRLGGNRGDNWIDGGSGHDAVYFSGIREQYTIAFNSEGVVVTDNIAGRDGRDVLTEVECLHFSDGPMVLAGACAHNRELMLDKPREGLTSNPPWPWSEFELEVHLGSAVQELMSCFDHDGNGSLSENEVEGDFRTLVALADQEGDGSASPTELLRAVDLVFSGEVRLTMDPMAEVERFFARFDLNGDRRIQVSELPGTLRQGFEEIDADGDGSITPDELLPSFLARE